MRIQTLPKGWVTIAGNLLSLVETPLQIQFSMPAFMINQ